MDRILCFVQKRTAVLLPAFLVLFSLNNLASTPPNFLLIISDDMGADVMPGYNIGTNLPNTPNLSGLAQHGLTFTNVWATPVCSASRASLMTGKYGINNGVNSVPGTLSTDHTSIFKQLNELTNNSYSSCLVGKWHLGREGNYAYPNEHGIDEFMGVMEDAIMNGYTFAWGADVSEKGFSPADGLCILPEDESTIQKKGKDCNRKHAEP